MGWKKTISGVAFIVVGAATLIVSLYIMAKGLGLVEGLDFGAGAYYYADIPEFQKYVGGDAYRTSVPVWVHILLFLGWGAIMYKLWTWIDGRK